MPTRLKRWKTGDNALTFDIIEDKDADSLELTVDDDTGNQTPIVLALDAAGAEEVIQILLKAKKFFEGEEEEVEEEEEEEEGEEEADEEEEEEEEAEEEETPEEED
jgi:hypothetical protein